MLFIAGISPKTSVKDQGPFHCPVCRNNTQYQILEQRSYFSLFFIKLFPVSKSKGAQLICANCRTIMPPSVLEH